MHFSLRRAIKFVDFPIPRYLGEQNAGQFSVRRFVKRRNWPRGNLGKFTRADPRHYLELFNLFGIYSLVVDLRHEVGVVAHVIDRALAPAGYFPSYGDGSAA